MNYVAKILAFLIVGLRPLLGAGRCCYAIGCTEFALIQLETESLFRAVYLIIKRLLQCSPIVICYRKN